MRLTRHIFSALLPLVAVGCGCGAPATKITKAAKAVAISKDTVLRMQLQTRYEITSLSQFSPYIRRLIGEINDGKATILSNLKQASNQVQRDSIFINNRFDKIFNLSGVIEHQLEKFADSLTFENGRDCPKELADGAQLLRDNGFQFYYHYPEGEPTLYLNIDAQAEYDFYKPYVSLKYAHYLQNLIYDQNGGQVLNDACVLLPMDSLLVRFDRWVKCGRLFDVEKEQNNPIYYDVWEKSVDYAHFMVVCNLDNCPTFDFDNGGKVYPGVKRKIIDAVKRLPKKYDVATEFMTGCIGLLESNNWTYWRQLDVYVHVTIKSMMENGH